jgi:hypothetical protein
MLKNIFLFVVMLLFVVSRPLSADVQSRFCVSRNGDKLLIAEPSQRFKYLFSRNGTPMTETGQFRVQPPDRIEFPNDTELSRMGLATRTESTISFSFLNRYTHDRRTVEFSKSGCDKFP